MYIKPTSRVHGSGFRMFEVGYMTIGDNNKLKEKLVLYTGADHIHTMFEDMIRGNSIWINMDLTRDGYIRIWGTSKQTLVWEKYPMSSSGIEVLPRDVEEDDKANRK